MERKTKEEKLAEEYIKERGFSFQTGFAINTEGMNPQDFEEIMFAGKIHGGLMTHQMANRYLRIFGMLSNLQKKIQM